MPSLTSNAGKVGERIARLPRLLALGRRLVHPLVVGQRVAVRPDHVGVDERRTLALAAVRGRPLHAPRTMASGVAAVAPRSTSRSGKLATSFEMLPPAVLTSTGTEMA